MTRPKSPVDYKTEHSPKKDVRSTTIGSNLEIRNSFDSNLKDYAAVVSTSDSLSVRTSNSSKRDSITSDAVLRDSRTSSGIVICEKTSIDERKQKKKRERKVYTQSRQSERIRRNRLEIDGEAPFKFLSLPYTTGKRKRDASSADDIPVDSPKAKIKKTSAALATTKRSRKKLQR